MMPRWQALFLLLFNTCCGYAARKSCGGTYTAARGVLRTPNFPGPFEVPLRCQWVIDSSNTATPNTTIVVYLTQLFTFEGLTFTEYQLYGPDYKINPKLIHKVNETNISKVRWVQTFQNYLVVELNLQSADSAHLRVLDKFLDVYGFNVTYEITSGAVRQNSCTMMDCGFTGECYDHYTKFSCDCFDGYEGPSCSEGPRSFCYSNGTPTCKNGATCIHVGVSAIKCHCTKGYTGNTCDTLVSSTVKDCPTCRSTCSFDGRLENACKCSRSKNLTASPSDRPSFFTTMHLSNLPNLSQEKLQNYIKSQLLRNLQANLSRVENLEVANMVHFLAGIDVTVQIFLPKKDEKRVKSIINKWTDRGYVGNITISEKDTSIRTLLSLQSVVINQPGVVRENDEFILSCVARGSPSMTFRWFKDGLFVNVTATSHKWIKLIKDPHVSDQYTALLAVERAHRYDEGQFTCQVEDFRVQQCMSKYVKIGRRPVVKIEPMSLTVRKGENFTVKCVTLEENGGNTGKYTYSWTKNKELLPVRTENEKYEILYPSGTILQIFNAERDVKYSCLVQDGAVAAERTVHVHVVPSPDVATCPSQAAYDLKWPETAPDASATLECPKGFKGVASRVCALRDGRKPAWGVPDFSQCTSDDLRGVYQKFEQLKLGYSSTTPEIILRSFLDYISKKNSSDILPGEGARILTMTQEVMSFISAVKIGNGTLKNVTFTVFEITDKILMTPNSLIKSSELRLLQQILFDQFKMSGSFLISQNEKNNFHISLNTIDLTILNVAFERYNEKHFKMPLKSIKNKGWVNVELTGIRHKNLIDKKEAIVAGVIFRNISNILPPKSFLRIKDGSELEYEVYSQIVSLISFSDKLEATPLAVDLKHEVLRSSLNISSGENLKVECGYADSSTFTYTWDIYQCKSNNLDETKTRCVCPSYGTYALLLTVVPLQPVKENDESQKHVLLTGCFTCLILSFFTTICLIISCFILRKSCLILLKMQCSFSIFLSVIIFSGAIFSGPPQKYYMPFITVLQMFLLLAMSSHLSKVLVVFTELIQLPRPVTSKYTVIGIISGVPVITVFGSHLAHRTMDVKLKSWWLIEGTLAFNIFVAVISIKCVLFLFLFVTVMKKLKELLMIHEKHGKPIRKRMGLLKRSFCVFIGITGYIISSIVYINNPHALWNIYQFTSANVILGFILIIFYVLKAETNIKSMFTNKSKTNSDDKFFSMDSTSSPLNFLTKQEAEINNQSGPPILDCQQFQLKSSELQKNPTLTKTQSISATFESCLHTSTSFCDGSSENNTSPTRECSTKPPLESYNSSPQTFRKFTPHSPDILSSKVCVELDLVASSICVPKEQNEPPRRVIFPPKVIITPDDAIAKILETETVLIQPERTQPDGHDENVTKAIEVAKKQPENIKEVEAVSKPTEKPSEAESDDKLFDSISHDLDYLLGKSEEVETVVTNVSTLRKVSKPPGANVIQKIPEELIEKDSNVAESITLRTNC